MHIHDCNDLERAAILERIRYLSSIFAAVSSRIRASAGLTPTQVGLLFSISQSGTGSYHGVSSLANRLRVSAAFIRAEAAALCKSGLIAKRTDPKDGRRLLLALTEHGNESLEELIGIQRRVNDVFFESLTRHEFLLFRQIMQRLARSAALAAAIASNVERQIGE